MADTFCPLPWMFQAVRNNGDYRICCQANVSSTRGILRKEDGRNANAAHDDPQAARNLPLMKEARRLMLQGQWPSSCTRCQSEESAGLRSRRLFERDIWNFTSEAARRSMEQDGTLRVEQSPILSYDIRFGNKCNLACRMCGPADSDAWYSDRVSLYGPSFLDTQGEVHLKQDALGHWQPDDAGYKWYEAGESFWNHLRENLAHLRHLHIVGGEPLLLKKHFTLLQEIVAAGHSRHITLEYNTNLTVLPEHVLELWAKFERVRVGVSLDGVGPVNEYIRHPSRWPVLERNLRRLDVTEGPIEAWISTTVQIYNIFNLPSLIRWRLESGFQRLNAQKGQPIITSHPLHMPEFFNIKSLTPDLKHKVRERFAAFIGELPQWIEGVDHPQANAELLTLKIRELLNGYVNYMDSEDRSAHFRAFREYNSRLDGLRQQSLAQVCPELNEVSL